MSEAQVFLKECHLGLQGHVDHVPLRGDHHLHHDDEEQAQQLVDLRRWWWRWWWWGGWWWSWTNWKGNWPICHLLLELSHDLATFLFCHPTTTIQYTNTIIIQFNTQIQIQYITIQIHLFVLPSKHYDTYCTEFSLIETFVVLHWVGDSVTMLYLSNSK